MIEVEEKLITGCRECPFNNPGGICNLVTGLETCYDGYPAACPLISKAILVILNTDICIGQ